MRTAVWLVAGVLCLPTLARAGNLEPSASPTNPASAMFTLQDLYDRAAVGAVATKRTGGFAGPSGGPTNGTGRTIDEIMAVLPSPADVQGSAQPGDVPSGLTFWGLTGNGWGVQTGTAAIVVDRVRGEYLRDISGPNPPLAGGTTGVLSGAFALNGRTASIVDRLGHSLTVPWASNNAVAFVAPPGTGVNRYSLRLDGTTMPVVVYLPNGTSSLLAETNSLPLAYATPMISSVSGGPCDVLPKAMCCPIEGGIVITVGGSDFGTNPSLISVTVGGLPCSDVTLILPDSRFSFVLPANPAGGYDEQVAVTVDGLTASAALLSYAGPVITDISVDGGTPGMHPVDISCGDTLVISGAKLNNGGSPSVKFGVSGGSFDDLAFTAEVISASDSEIRCVVPLCVGENLELQIKTGLQFAPSGGQVLRTPQPVIVGDSLRASPSAAGGSTLFGTSTDGQIVYFDVSNVGDNAALLTVYMDSTNECYNIVTLVTTNVCGGKTNHPIRTIGCTLPHGMGGGHLFTVKALDALSPEGSDVFIYPVCPQVTNATGCVDVPPATTECPTAGNVPVTLGGEYFSSNALAVFIGGNAVKASCGGPSRITCALPPGVGKQIPVVVQCDGQSSMPKPYVSYASPALTCVTAGPPARVAGATVTDLPRAGGIEIQIQGANFGAAGGQLLLAGTLCTNLVHDAANPHSVVTAILPPRSAPPYNDLPLLFINSAGELATNIVYVSYTE